MAFVKNWLFFHLFILGKIGQENVFHDILERKNAFPYHKSVETLGFYQSIVLIKNWQFFHIFILGKIGQENMFHDILERKNAFLDFKTKKFKKSDTRFFFKGVSP